MNKYVLFLFGAFLVSATASVAQTKMLIKRGHTKSKKFYGASNDKSKGISFSAGLGIASYFGELCETGDCFQESRPQLSLGARYRFNSNISARGEVQWYRIGGRDRRIKNGEVVKTDRTNRNLSFRSDNYEITAAFQLDVLPNTSFYESYDKRRPFNIYGILGVGVSAYFPEAYYMDKTGNNEARWYYLRELQTEGKKYSVFTPILLTGVGARAKISPSIDVAVEVAYRFTNTDYLDDVSGKNIDKSYFETANIPNDKRHIAAALSDRRPEIGMTALPAGTIRGDNSTKDGYYIIGAKVEYTLSHKKYMGVKKQRMLKKYRRKVPRYR